MKKIEYKRKHYNTSNEECNKMLIYIRNEVARIYKIPYSYIHGYRGDNLKNEKGND